MPRRRLSVLGGEPLEQRRLLALTPVQFDQTLDIEVVGDRLYFSSAYEFIDNTPGNTGVELWVSDGTTNGTRLVKDIRPGLASSSPENLTNVNGTLFFTARTDSFGVELWKTDGTTAGTVLVKDTSPGTNSGDIGELANVNGLLFFRARGPNGTNAAWVSDGTTAGTVMLREFYAGETRRTLGPFVEMNGAAFFAAETAAEGVELWKSDGTIGGTVIVKDLNPGSANGLAVNYTNVNGTLFFSGWDGTNGVELWKTDGTGTGTVLVKDIQSGNGSSNPSNLVNLNGVLYFGALFGSPGATNRLWQSDGTSAGTVMVKQVSTSNMTNVGGTLYFRSNGLSSSDGTTAGTNVVTSSITPNLPLNFQGPTFVGAANLVFFPATEPNRGTALYKTDNTLAGTGQVAFDTGIPSNLTAFDDLLYFRAENDQRLLRTDGNTTIRFQGLNPADTNGVPVSPFPYADSFTRPDSSSLSGPWLEQLGDLRIANNRLELAANAEAVASLNGLFQTDISVRVDYDLTGDDVGRSVGVLARYTGLGDANTYMARVIRDSSNTFSAQIWVNLNGVYTPLASVPTSASAGALQFDVVGDRLSLSVDGVLLASVTNTSITGAGSAGVRMTGGRVDNFLVTAPTVIPPVNVTLPFTDNFNRANNPHLGAEWTERLGDLRIFNNQLVQQLNAVSITTLNGPSVANVDVQAFIDLTTLADTGSSIGLLARYSGPGDSNGYMARLFRSSGAQYFVQIWRNAGSGWEFLDQNPVGSGAGSLRFLLSGTTLEAYWDNVLTVSVTDSAIAGAGQIGIRHAGGALDNFAAA
ncbi:MAG: hypothetical protein KF708_20795 [Pirellulales bacterium]|nr:hypothetical protein [Pirellulales bacterium]